MQKRGNHKLWATLMRKQKIISEVLFPCTPEEVLHTGLIEACKAFDIACPVVLKKHESELLQFSRTSFSPRDFIDAFPYSYLCLELFSEDTGKGTLIEHT